MTAPSPRPLRPAPETATAGMPGPGPDDVEAPASPGAAGLEDAGGTATRPVPPTAAGLQRVAAELLRRRPAEGFCVGLAAVHRLDGLVVHAHDLAVALAPNSGRDTVVIEADLRGPGRLDHLLGLEPGPGLAAARGQAGAAFESIVRAPEPGVWALPAGRPAPGDPAVSPPLTDVVARIRRAGADAVVALPPLDERGDGHVAALACDIVVMVVERDRTRRDALADAVHRLGRERLAGAVMVAAPRRRVVVDLGRLPVAGRWLGAGSDRGRG